jgi:hypothetical protein
MISSIVKLFRKPSARTLAQIELEETRRLLLSAQTRYDYSKSQVDFYQACIRRLETTLRAEVLE